jgi:hypothetical protein
MRHLRRLAQLTRTAAEGGHLGGRPRRVPSRDRTDGGADTQNMTFPVAVDGAPATRYGAAATGVADAVNVLRARAWRDGVTLAEASPVDLAAAVIGADAWMWLHHTDTLERPATHGRAAVASLAAILARAAGHRTYVTGDVFDDLPVDVRPDAAGMVDAYWAWLADHLGPGAVDAVFRRAAADLAAGAGDATTTDEHTVTAFAALLDATRHTPS